MHFELIYFESALNPIAYLLKLESLLNKKRLLVFPVYPISSNLELLFSKICGTHHAGLIARLIAGLIARLTLRLMAVTCEVRQCTWL